MCRLAEQFVCVRARPRRQEFQEQRYEIRQLRGADLETGLSYWFLRSIIACPRSRLSPCTCSNRCSDSERVRSNSST